MKIQILSRLAFLGLLFVPFAAPAQEKDAGKGYILAKRGQMPPVGTTVSQKTTTQYGESKVTAEGENIKREGTSISKGAENVVLEGIAPGKMRYTLASHTSEHRETMQGSEKVSPEKADPLQGIPLIVEYKDGDWSVALEKGEPDDAQKEGIDKVRGNLQAEEEFKIFGDTPRKPGDKWDVDLKGVTHYLAMEKPEGSLKVEFVGIKDLDGTPCAVLKSSFDLSGMRAGGGMPTKIKVKGEIIRSRSLVDLMDLESKFTSTTTYQIERPKFTLTVEGPFVGESSARVEKKKAE